MAEAATASAEEPRGRCGRRSDGGSAIVGYLGDFARGPVLFTLYRLGPDQGRYPNGPCEYLIDCDDGVGPHEVCRFAYETAEVYGGEGIKAEGLQATWRGAWKNDLWCPWLLKRAWALIPDSEKYLKT